ncbi:hypothetical protein C5E06_02080 [Pseudoclavibacter sp. RFBI5]|uniref:hypothetical protein n=1 Tax=Pseudoclavibacter sp. RFBI5 TaxID=2080578 RepID=UPI000CE8C216|nr:hypothetical protein [Pseudoclavibacter sp. RFBI5]PPG05162.1 hypothetical protein C5E06_02080 [Pseudoclavibacter sp. RFBI5]
MTGDRPGFRSFASTPLAIALWVATVGATALFLALGWNLLQMAILIVPLAAVSVAVTVSALKKTRGGTG